MLKIKIVGKMTLTQNGRRAAFTVTAIEADENNILNYKYRPKFLLPVPSIIPYPYNLQQLKTALVGRHGVLKVNKLLLTLL